MTRLRDVSRPAATPPQGDQREGAATRHATPKILPRVIRKRAQGFEGKPLLEQAVRELAARLRRNPWLCDRTDKQLMVLAVYGMYARWAVEGAEALAWVSKENAALMVGVKQPAVRRALQKWAPMQIIQPAEEVAPGGWMPPCGGEEARRPDGTPALGHLLQCFRVDLGMLEALEAGDPPRVTVALGTTERVKPRSHQRSARSHEPSPGSLEPPAILISSPSLLNPCLKPPPPVPSAEAEDRPSVLRPEEVATAAQDGRPGVPGPAGPSDAFSGSATTDGRNPNPEPADGQGEAIKGGRGAEAARMTVLRRATAILAPESPDVVAGPKLEFYVQQRLSELQAPPWHHTLESAAALLVRACELAAETSDPWVFLANHADPSSERLPPALRLLRVFRSDLTVQARLAAGHAIGHERPPALAPDTARPKSSEEVQPWRKAKEAPPTPAQVAELTRQVLHLRNDFPG